MPTSSESANANTKPARRPGPARRFLSVTLRVFAVILLVLVLAVAALAWRISIKPLSFGMFAPYIERAIDDEARGLRFSFEDGAIAWRQPPPDLRDRINRGIELRLTGLTVRDEAGRDLLSVPHAAIGLSTRALRDGAIAPSFLAISGLSLSLDWQEGDLFDALARGGGDNAYIAALIESLLQPPRRGGTTGYLRRVIVRGADVRITEHLTFNQWLLSDATILLRRRRDSLDLEASGSFGQSSGAAAGILINGRYLAESGDTAFAIQFTDLNPSRLAGDSEALARLRGLDMDWDGSVDFRLTTDQDVEQIHFDLASKGGRVQIADLYAEPVAIDAALVRGSYSPARKLAAVDAVELDFAGAAIRGDGVYWSEDIGPGVKFQGRIERLPFAVLDAYWPQGLAPGARDWVTRNIESGLVDQGEFTVAIDPAMWGRDALPEEAVDFRFGFSGITAHYLRPMPPITGGAGDAQLTATTFRLNTSQATTARVRVRKGKLRFDDIHLAGKAMANLDLDLQGTAEAILALIDHEPLGYPSDYGLKPETVDGAGRVDLKIKFPLIKDVSLGDVDFNVKARVADLAIAGILDGVALSSPDLALDIDRDGLEGRGPIALNSVPFTLRWTEDFGKGDGLPSRFTLTGTVANEEWRVLSLPFEDVVAGPVAVVLELQGQGPRILRGQGRFDFARAAMKFTELGWNKAPGQPSLARFRFDKPDDDRLIVRDLIYEDEALRGSGNLTVAEDGLRELVIDNLRLGRSYLAGTVTRSAHNQYAIAVTADAIDASHFIEETLSGKDGRGLMPDFTLDALAARVHALGDVAVEGVTAKAAYRNGRWQSAELTGDFSGGEKLAFHLMPNADPETRDKFPRRFLIRSDNAANVAKGLGLFENAQGGVLDFRGLLTEPGDDQLVEGRVDVQSFRVIEAPVLANILTVGSLTGIRDILSGEGIRFDQMRVPFRLSKGVIRISDARASGPAIGLTMNGELSLVSHQTALNGTIVPAYTANSVLGKVPVLGSLLTGGKGQGVFALTYRVKGQLPQPTIDVNPLSMLAPGFLRSIFMNDVKLEDEGDEAE